MPHSDHGKVHRVHGVRQGVSRRSHHKGSIKELHHINPAICVDPPARACTSARRRYIENPAGITPERIRRRTDWPKPEIIDELCTGCNFSASTCAL